MQRNPPYPTTHCTVRIGPLNEPPPSGGCLCKMTIRASDLENRRRRAHVTLGPGLLSGGRYRNTTPFQFNSCFFLFSFLFLSVCIFETKMLKSPANAQQQQSHGNQKRIRISVLFGQLLGAQADNVRYANMNIHSVSTPFFPLPAGFII